MAHFGKDLDDFKGSRCVHIRSAEQTENFTIYVITLTVGPYSWTVKHRYSEFHDLHEKLVASHKLDKTLLPPKKMFGNQTESFIKKRQRELEIYLQTIILYMAQHIPPCLAAFLDFTNYEIHGITQSMAEDLYTRGETLLQSKEKYQVNTLQLYSLTERLKLPEPTCESGDVKKDLGHILDFITRAKHLKIKSTSPVGSSNIIMSRLPFDLILFKSLQSLEICGCNFRLISGLETVKQTLSKLVIHESSSSLKEIILQDNSHWRGEDGCMLVAPWIFVTHLDLSRNSFTEIHESIQLMPNVEDLNMSQNLIENVQNLQWLSQLTNLDLANNNIRHLDSLHTKLGNVKVINLSNNKLEALHGFAKLFSLHTLNISNNKISTIEEVSHICQLPCIEMVNFEGNAVTSSLDYRTKTLEMFSDRVKEIVLDGKPPDQKELDTVAVLQALRKAKDVKAVKQSAKKTPSSVSLSEMYSKTPPGSVGDNHSIKDLSEQTLATGVLSRSVPASDWSRRESEPYTYSVSPFSQKSVSSQSSHDNPPFDPVPEAHPFDLPIHSTNTSNQSSNANNNNDHSEDTQYQYIPEAHPFDLSIENPASISPKSPTIYQPSIYNEKNKSFDSSSETSTTVLETSVEASVSTIHDTDLMSSSMQEKSADIKPGASQPELNNGSEKRCVLQKSDSTSLPCI